jgi:hypothetical protein
MGLESWFVGYIAARADWEEPMRSQKQIQSICTGTPSQFAALKAAELYSQTHGEQVRSLVTAKAEIMDDAERRSIRALPSSVAHLIALVDKTGTIGSELEGNGFVYADGADFGVPGVLRLLISANGATVKALARL